MATNEQEQRWTQRPDGSTWGDFGPDDQLGRANLLTAEKVRQGLAEVREGLTFCLSLPLDLPGGNVLNPRRHPPVLRPTLRDGKPNMNYRLELLNPLHSDVICDDLAILHLQYSTQWDSFAHIGQMFDANGDGLPEAVYYNGYRAGPHIFGPVDGSDAGVPERGANARSTSAARKLGIEHMAVHGMQGRGVMIDLQANLGSGRTLVGYDILMRVLDQDRVVVEPGDMVCLRTGFAQALIDMKGQPDGVALQGVGAVLDGRDERLLQWITDSGLASLIADNYAVEAHPAEPRAGPCATLPLHAHCLFKLGVNLGEMWLLTHLADWLRANGRSRFLQTAPPLRLPGAVGSPVTPIATV
ncbi:cyclase family protein [Variovorax sp. J22R133]|uniref:cyclase family protein n=1 Tax=Variovorax brevis TaxID=3053503 RepID=UPI002576FBAF|nr:cyclase family protein [Variovorax sp. J22R133]MDM0111199.1 cyclase family protein [Variovorax sp. J22R133]